MVVTKLYFRRFVKGNLLGFCDIVLDDVFVVKGLTVANGSNGKYVQFPKKQGKDKEWHELCHPITAELRTDITNKVLAEEAKTEGADNNKTPANTNTGEDSWFN